MDNEPRRQADIAIAELTVMLREHIERYERELNQTNDWRMESFRIQAEHTALLNEIAPNYRRGILVVSTILVVTITYVIKAILSHFKWS